MTHAQVAELFERFNTASTWPSNDPRVFLFHRDGGEERTVDLSEDDGLARYLRVPIEEVRDHIEQTGEVNSQNVYYRLRSAA